MPQYLMSVCHEDEYDLEFDNDEDLKRIGGKVGAFNDELTAAEDPRAGGGLMPASSASVFRPDGTTVTDGPFAETKEQIGGFWVISVDTDEEARELARRASIACELPVELRSFQACE